MTKFDVAIIGSGLGGLLCATLLSKEGLQVCLIEKNNKPGGSLQTFGRKGCIFNTGLNYTESLDKGQVLNQYFRYFGLTEDLPFKKLDPEGFEVISFSDKQYRFAMGEARFIETLSAEFPAEREGLTAYTRRIRELCNSIPLYSLRADLSNLFENYDLSQGAADFIRSVIHNHRLQNVLAGNSLLYAGHEGKTPLLIHALINHSFIESAWRVSGGSHLVVEKLVSKIRAYGGTVLTKACAKHLPGEQNLINGVELENGEMIQAKFVIADIHPYNVLDMVSPGMIRKAFDARIRSLEDTLGMFTLYLVFKPGTFPYLNYNFYHFNQNNTWVASDYRLSEWPQNFLLMTSAARHAPQYAESASVITYMDYQELKSWENTCTGDRGESYLDFKQEKADILLNSVDKQFPGIRTKVDAMYTSTPLTWRDYTGTRAGSPYGLMKDFNRPLESMIVPRTKIRNLFLTGQNTNVHGVLGVTISSVVTCSEILDIRYLLKRIENA
jgi:all-trans-retinol 13,14-reductase